jgi:hypothetical protein
MFLFFKFQIFKYLNINYIYLFVITKEKMFILGIHNTAICRRGGEGDIIEMKLVLQNKMTLVLLNMKT